MKRIKMIMALAVAMLAAGSANVFAQDGTYDDMIAKYNEGTKLYAAKNYAAAAPLLEEVVNIGINIGEEETPQVTFAKQAAPDAYRRAGQALAAQEKYDEALAILAKGKKAANNFKQNSNKIADLESQIYTVMAAGAFNSKDYAKAAGIYKKGYDANPRDTELGMNLALCYLEMTPQDTAGYEVYRQIIALENVHSKYADAAKTAKDKYAYYKLLSATEKANAKDYAAAIALAEDAATVNPASDEAFMLVVQAATNAKNFKKVTEIGDKAAEAQTDAEKKADVYFMMGAAYENLGNKAKAIEYYGKVTAGSNAATAKAQITSLQKEE